MIDGVGLAMSLHHRGILRGLDIELGLLPNLLPLNHTRFIFY